MEEVVETAIARNAEYPSDIGEQMPQLTNSRSYSEPESSCKESEVFPPQARICGEMGLETRTKIKGYSPNYIATGSEDPCVSDDLETSVKGGVWIR